MLRVSYAAVLALSLLACGKTEEPKKTADPVKKNTGGTTNTPKGDPDGTYPCVKCGVKWKEPKCTSCGAVLKVDTGTTNTGGGTSTSHTGGGTAVGVTYKCPKSGCNFTDARAGKCFPHPDVDLKECWYVCAGCAVKETAKGKCKKCGKELTESLQ